MSALKKSFWNRLAQSTRSDEDTKNPTTLGLFLGASEAEGENLDYDWFTDCFALFDLIAQGKYLIIGRKGTGKSAIVKRLSSIPVDPEVTLSTKTLNHNDLKFEASICNGGMNVGALYEWIILISLGELILYSGIGGDYIPEYKALNEFFKINRGVLNIDENILSRFTNDKEWSVRVGPIINMSLKKSDRREKTATTVEFFKFIPELRKVILKLLEMDIYSNIIFLVMFDDLDIGYRLDDTAIQENLIELIRVTRDYNTKYLNRLDSKVLLFLRDDVERNLNGADADIAKAFASSSFRLEWYNHQTAKLAETEIPLRQFINRRIKGEFERHGWSYNIQDPWKSLVKEAETAKGQTQFRHILDWTLYRPRDLLLFFKSIKDTPYELPLDKTSIESIKKTYLEDLYKEIQSELAIVYDKKDQNQLSGVFSQMARELKESRGGRKSALGYERLMEICKSHKMNPKTIENMTNYGLMIPIDRKGDLHLIWREATLKLSPDQYSYTLPNFIYDLFAPRN